ncbi:NnrU family protein [Algihabitans albus]|uniref:NnrU family protein n=1 Tax=Algihabitans albus TaxID=2164067 RepID=UPI000E5CBEF1|nr:NnrU family protein [Algihabitans albus]
MAGWTEYALAFLAFFLSHALPVRPPVKRRLVAGLGPQGFTLGYSLLSLALLAWLIAAAGRAPFLPLWGWAPWQATIPLTAMAAVCLLVALGLGRPNPFSFGGLKNETFDPARPGLVRWTRHPLLLALAIWAAAHMPPNGDLAHLLLFGSFAAFALLGMRLIDRRKRRQMGEDWEDLVERVRESPKPTGADLTVDLAWRLSAAALLYILLLLLHPQLFGVSPLP